MKLEGELAFVHSKMGVELDSQSFEFNDSDENSGIKSRNQKANEYDNSIPKNVKKNERDFDSSPNDMKSGKCTPAPKLEFYNSDIDLKNSCEPKSHSSKDERGLDSSPELEFYDSTVDFNSDYEAQIMNSHELVPHSSNDIGSFMMFANDDSVKKSIALPISNPLQVDKFQNSIDYFVDRTVTECEPELEVCYKENSYHVVKDICVDDQGVFTKHKFMFEESVDGKAYNFFPVESFDDNQKTKDNTAIKVLDQPETEESDEVSLNHDQHKDVMHEVHGEIEDLVDNVTKVMDLHGDVHDSMPTEDKDQESSGEPDLHTQSKESNIMVEEEVQTSPALGLAVDELNGDSFPSAPAGVNSDEAHLPFVEGLSGGDFSEIHPAETSQIHRGGFGESSFAAGTVSGRISYSGSIPYSGSISIRSDSSTTSTRSFAFPILQSEWNSSPVRMEKADRRSYRKQRKWKNGLLCCKF